MIVKFYIDNSFQACRANCSLIYINGVRLILLRLYLAENIIIIQRLFSNTLESEYYIKLVDCHDI
jgi:hypothetical protein